MNPLSVRRTAAWRAIAHAASLVALLVIGATPAFAQQTVADGRRVDEPATATVLTRPVTVHFDKLTLTAAVKAIAKSAGVRVQYQTDVLEAFGQPVSLSADKLPLGIALTRVLSGTRLEVVPMAEDLVTIRTVAVLGTPVQGPSVIVGQVLNAATRQPVVGVTIRLDETSAGVTTDQDGRFRLPATAGAHVVHVRAVGFLRQSKSVTVGDDPLQLVVALTPSTSVLDEIVVTGTIAPTERKAMANPITVITAADIEQRGVTRVDQLLRGEVPGVVVIEEGSRSYRADALGGMATVSVYSRGSSTLGASPNPPKTYIDGVEMLNPAYLGTIDVKTIDRIEIIAGPQAATVYGSGALGGVMQIFTKKGKGRAGADAQLSLQSGFLENNLVSSLTPAHNHGLSVTGGSGPEFSYSANASYGYTGQWQPAMFNRTYGGSVGANHTHGPLTASGSVSINVGTNGTGFSLPSGAPVDRGKQLAGDWIKPASLGLTQMQSTSSSQTVSLNIDHRITSAWQHHLTLGRSQTDLGLVPLAPALASPTDSLYRAQSSTGKRNTLGYNTTIAASPISAVSSTLTLGANGSTGDQVQVKGCLLTSTATTYINCTSTETPSITTPSAGDSWGGFGSWQLGFFKQMFLTLALRGETNPNYGREHRVDWTPNSGITYTIEHDDATLKLLASYGRATRPPPIDRRLQTVTYLPAGYNVSQYIGQAANDELGPEYSHGPQGGFEFYYGNRGSLTVNYYRQYVDNLIQSINIDSIPLIYMGFTAGFARTTKNVNFSSILQKGWETTGSVNLWRFNTKATYSWMDSRVYNVPESLRSFYEGRAFTSVPTHTGNVTVSYAHQSTSVTLTTNYMGKMSKDITFSTLGNLVFFDQQYSRLLMYINRSKPQTGTIGAPGYLKSNLVINQRLTQVASVTLNVTNLGNSYGSDANGSYPTLGRQTLLGLTLRYPTR